MYHPSFAPSGSAVPRDPGGPLPPLRPHTAAVSVPGQLHRQPHLRLPAAGGAGWGELGWHGQPFAYAWDDVMDDVMQSAITVWLSLVHLYS